MALNSLYTKRYYNTYYTIEAITRAPHPHFPTAENPKNNSKKGAEASTASVEPGHYDLPWWWAGTRKCPGLRGWGLPIMGTGSVILGGLYVDMGRNENKRNIKVLSLSWTPSFTIETGWDSMDPTQSPLQSSEQTAIDGSM